MDSVLPSFFGDKQNHCPVCPDLAFRTTSFAQFLAHWVHIGYICKIVLETQMTGNDP